MVFYHKQKRNKRQGLIKLLFGLTIAFVPLQSGNATSNRITENRPNIGLLLADVSISRERICTSTSSSPEEIGRICVVDINNVNYLFGGSNHKFSKLILNFPVGTRPNAKFNMHVLYLEEPGYLTILDSGTGDMCLNRDIVEKYGIRNELIVLIKRRAIRWSCPNNPIS